MSELIHRPRRLRRTAALRELMRETRLDPANLIYPMFVCPGEGVRREVRSMPGVFNFSIDELVKECADARRAGVSSIIVFGLPENKDEQGSEAFAEDGITQRAIRALKREVKEMVVIADTCLCEYTSHGHCGVIEDQDVANDPTSSRLRE
jgi:porphobilinogen synthase